MSVNSRSGPALLYTSTVNWEQAFLSFQWQTEYFGVEDSYLDTTSNINVSSHRTKTIDWWMKWWAESCRVVTSCPSAPTSSKLFLESQTGRLLWQLLARSEKIAVSLRALKPRVRMYISLDRWVKMVTNTVCRPLTQPNRMFPVTDCENCSLRRPQQLLQWPKWHQRDKSVPLLLLLHGWGKNSPPSRLYTDTQNLYTNTAS